MNEGGNSGYNYAYEVGERVSGNPLFLKVTWFNFRILASTVASGCM